MLGHYGSGIHETTPALIIRSWEIQPRSSQQNGRVHGPCQRLVAARLCWRRPEASLRTVFIDNSFVCSLLLCLFMLSFSPVGLLPPPLVLRLSILLSSSLLFGFFFSLLVSLASQWVESYVTASTVGTTTTEGVVANTTTTAAAAVTAAAAPVQTTVQPLKSAAASRDKTTPRHLQKRSTLAGGDNSSTDFHVEKESESSSVPNRAGISAEDSTDTNAPTGSWQTTNTGSDSTGNRNEADANSNKGFMNGTNYKALFG